MSCVASLKFTGIKDKIILIGIVVQNVFIKVIYYMLLYIIY